MTTKRSQSYIVQGHQITQTSHGFAVKDAVYHTGSAWAKAKADAVSTLALGVVTQSVDADNFILTQNGLVKLTAHGLTVGVYYYLSAATAGLLTATEPSSYSDPLLYVIDADMVLVLPYRPVGTTTPLLLSGSTLSLDIQATRPVYKNGSNKLDLRIPASTPGLAVNGSGELDVKRKSGGGIGVDSDGIYADVATAIVGDNTQYEMFMNGQVF